MKDMTRSEIETFLMAGTRTGKLATVKADGGPHVVPIWFVLDGDDNVFTTWHTSVKARNLRSHDRAALSVDVERPPYAFVMVDGPVSISDDMEEARRFATRIGARYMGDDRAEEFGERNAVEGELVVRLRMEKVVGKDDMAG
jgi:PPOX class probable F420-dependent enzyme